MTNLVYPEWIERQDRPLSEEPWEVSPGPSARGEAWTDIRNRRMRIPADNDEAARVIRAHEMVHAKISPELGPIIPDGDELHRVPMAKALVTACEEARVNHVASEAGFDMKKLVDGSEKTAGYNAAKSNNPNFVTLDMIAMFGTGAVNPYMSGIRKAVKDGKADKSMLEHATNVKKLLTRATREWKRWPVNLSSTVPVRSTCSATDITYPDGYEYTLSLANTMSRLMISEDIEKVPGLKDVPTGPGEGKFAPPVVKQLPLTRRVVGRMNRKRIATNVGTNPRRMNRMLTDPERRVFDRRATDIGGVVLIDQSGSMSLSEYDVWQIINASPGCVVIGYSHRSGSADPNIWVIADRGRVVEHVPHGNGGNGVDGPALLYALSKRKGREPFIWVCDGYVTDNQDHCRDNLSKVCANIVRSHGIHMVPDVDEAIDALRRVSRGEKLKTRLVGVLAAH